MGLGTAERVQMLQQPWRLPVLAGRLARTWTRLAADGRRLRREEDVDAVVVGYLGHFDVHLARLLFRRSTVVLDHLVFAADTARDRGESGSVKQRLLRTVDRAALRAADVIVVDTVEHADLVPAEQRHKVVVVLVGADDAWAAAGRGRVERSDDAGPLSIVFYGLFTPLQGTPVIARALAGDRDLPVTVSMVGRGQDLDEARGIVGDDARVTWTDWVEPASLPTLVASHDVCLGIFGDGDKARRVVPNKVFQGLLAGCLVVTSDTPPQRREVGDLAVLVPPGDAVALASTLRDLVGHRAGLAERAREAAREGARRFAPEAVVAPLWERLTAPAGRVASRRR